MILPLALAVCGIICSIIGSFLVKTKEDATQKSLLTSLRTGTYTAAVLSAIICRRPVPTSSWARTGWASSSPSCAV